MSRLLLVRHGQGGATPERYDELSPLGQEQSRRLGRWLLEHGQDFAGSMVGQLRRQRETLATIAALYAEAGRSLPAAQVLSELDEYRFTELIAAFARRNPSHPELAVVRERPADKRLWVGLLHASAQAWMADELDGIPETYREFKQRAARALAHFLGALEQGPLLAVSSGGLMSAILQQVLELPDRAAIELNLTLMNTGLCEFRLHRGSLRLLSLNTLPHLSAAADRELLSVV